MAEQEQVYEARVVTTRYASRWRSTVHNEGELIKVSSEELVWATSLQPKSLLPVSEDAPVEGPPPSPIPDLAGIPVREALARAQTLNPDELLQVIEAEEEGRNRSTLTSALEDLRERKLANPEPAGHPDYDGDPGRLPVIELEQQQPYPVEHAPVHEAPAVTIATEGERLAGVADPDGDPGREPGVLIQTAGQQVVEEGDPQAAEEGPVPPVVHSSTVNDDRGDVQVSPGAGGNDPDGDPGRKPEPPY